MIQILQLHKGNFQPLRCRLFKAIAKLGLHWYVSLRFGNHSKTLTLNKSELTTYTCDLRLWGEIKLKISVETNFLRISFGNLHTCFLVFGYFLFKEIGFPLKRNHIHEIKRIGCVVFSFTT